MSTTSTYTGRNDPLTVTDPAGVVTTYTYDVHGNVLSSSTPLQGTADVRTTTFTYGDAAHPGDATAETDPVGAVTSFTYNSHGDVVVKDPNNNKTTASYDEWDANSRRCLRWEG